MNPTLSERFAQFAHGLDSSRVPPAVFEKAKWLVLDTVGLCAASSQLDYGIAISRLVQKWGGAGEATVIGSGAKVPMHNAALCNGVLAHGQDYDDTHTEAVVHSSAALVPVALAVAESLGASGREMLEAFVAGTEIALRIALPARNKFHQRGFHTTSVATTFGSALVTSRLLKMNPEETIAALGTCGSVLSGLVECVPAGANAKRLHAGWAAQAGISAVQLAREGYTGPATIFDGKCGLYNALLWGESIDLGEVLQGLGERWELLEIRPKAYPCCHYLQAFIDCAAHLRRAHSLTPDVIERIRCRTAQGAANIVCEPWDKKLNPTTPYTARFSLPFAVAVMLVRGKAGTEDFAEDAIADPAIRRVMSQVSYEVDPKYEVKDMPAWVEVTTRRGEIHRHEIPVVYGGSEHPIDPGALMEKFRANTHAWGENRAAEVAAAIRRLESIAKVDALAQMLGV